MSRCHGLSPARARSLVGAEFSLGEAAGLWVAAVRQLFTSTGILLAADTNGRPAAANAVLQADLAAGRLPVFSGASGFSSFLRERSLLCDAGRLVYFSHWRTGSEDMAGRSTRIFLAQCPHDQISVPPENTGQLRWVTPDQALELFRTGELPMTIPTFASMRALADFDGVTSVLSEYERTTGGRNP